LETQSFSAIIASKEIVPRVLENIYASSFSSRPHTIVVVGDISQQTLASVASNIKVLKFGEVEREGIKIDNLVSKLPGKSFYISPPVMRLTRM
jgi:long-chain acyl-CoA synthetase